MNERDNRERNEGEKDEREREPREDERERHTHTRVAASRGLWNVKFQGGGRESNKTFRNWVMNNVPGIELCVL